MRRSPPRLARQRAQAHVRRPTWARLVQCSRQPVPCCRQRRPARSWAPSRSSTWTRATASLHWTLAARTSSCMRLSCSMAMRSWEARVSASRPRTTTRRTSRSLKRSLAATSTRAARHQPPPWLCSTRSQPSPTSPQSPLSPRRPWQPSRRRPSHRPSPLRRRQQPQVALWSEWHPPSSRRPAHHQMSPPHRLASSLVRSRYSTWTKATASLPLTAALRTYLCTLPTFLTATH
mmetsp:Transcript_18619/g.37715  ORF Transcript_18619/g.37715 Transcript_18619/m.37715 type:complete len:233 (+) Transcript_18619:324-1022(+)